MIPPSQILLAINILLSVALAGLYWCLNDGKPTTNSDAPAALILFFLTIFVPIGWFVWIIWRFLFYIFTGN